MWKASEYASIELWRKTTNMASLLIPLTALTDTQLDAMIAQLAAERASVRRLEDQKATATKELTALSREVWMVKQRETKATSQAEQRLTEELERVRTELEVRMRTELAAVASERDELREEWERRRTERFESLHLMLS